MSLGDNCHQVILALCGDTFDDLVDSSGGSTQDLAGPLYDGPRRQQEAMFLRLQVLDVFRRTL